MSADSVLGGLTDPCRSFGGLDVKNCHRQAHHGVYADTIRGNGSPNCTNPNYDLGTIGYLMWGHSLLHNAIFPIDKERADAIARREIFSGTTRM